VVEAILFTWVECWRLVLVLVLVQVLRAAADD
jgi:hypothetical protein